MSYVRIWIHFIFFTKNRVWDYIKNQEEHHRVRTFKEEYDLFIEKYKFKLLG